MKFNTHIMLAAAMAGLTAGANAATLLFSDNFNTVGNLDSGDTFNTPASLAADQSGSAATQTYTTVLGGGWGGAYQRGNAGTWLMHTGFGSTGMKGSLNYDIAAAANAQAAGNQALEISFNMSVTLGVTDDDWTSFTIGNQNPFVNAGTVGFSSLFRDSGGTQQFSNGNAIGSSASFTDGQLITFILSDASGSGSAFSDSNGANDIVKMYVNGSLTNEFTGLNLDATDQFISFHANQTIANIDDLSITAIPEPSAALLGGLGLLALLRRKR